MVVGRAMARARCVGGCGARCAQCVCLVWLWDAAWFSVCAASM